MVNFPRHCPLINPKKRLTILLGKRGIRGVGPLLGCNNDGSCISNYISWVIARFIPIKVGSKKKREKCPPLFSRVMKKKLASF